MNTLPGITLDGTTLVNPVVGVTDNDILALSPKLDVLRQRLRAWREGQPPTFLHLPFRDDVRAITERGAYITGRFARTVVLSIGGASLGGETLVRCLGRRNHPIRFFDNIDPLTLAEIDTLDWTTTAMIVISKSGETAETLAQFLSLLPRLEERLGARLREHVTVITENRLGALWQLASTLGLNILPHPPIGGRFSVLSLVGLLPAAIAGVDIAALLSGARTMVEQCTVDSIESNPAFFQASAQYLHARRGRHISVFMPYVDRLHPLGLWYRQLLAESLGKHDHSGQAQGLTPTLAMGATDQHSQLQLYLDGPDDKQYTLLSDPGMEHEGERVPERFGHLPAVQSLIGHTTGELLLAEYRATRDTLARHARPNRAIALDTRDPAALGALILLLELETVVIAELMQVDPFDQPAVEEGKRLARNYLNK